jgi:Uma2 family endonuclease
MSMQQAAVPSDPSDIPEAAPVSPSSSSPQSEREQRVILHGVSWATYESLLADFQDSHAAHFTYDRGVLEIMVLSLQHEKTNRRLHSLFEAIATEADIDFENAGSTTFKREDLARGFEPDTCFYVQNVEHIRRKEEIDLTEDPPPDLIIEADVTSTSLNKLPIYAAIGVREVWRYESQNIVIFRLEGSEYRQLEESVILPGVTGSQLSSFVKESRELTRPAWERRVREWARQQKKRD